MNTERYSPRLTSPTLHFTIFFFVALFFTILAISVLLKIEVVARGKGRVVPVTRVQVIQPEFSGRLIAINVRNGMLVKKGQILIEIDSTDAKVKLTTIKEEIDRLHIEMARINAMLEVINILGSNSSSHIQFQSLFHPPKDLADHPFAHEQRVLFYSETKDIEEKIHQIHDKEQINTKIESVIMAKIEKLDQIISIQNQHYKSANKLFDKGVLSKSSFLDVKKQFLENVHQRKVLQKELEQKVAERKALETELKKLISDTRSRLLRRKAEIIARLAELKEQLRAERRRLEAAILRAPVDGIVNELKVYTIGGVAKAGEELLQIVPVDTEIEIEGIFPNSDVGFLKVGQQANIKLDAYPSERFGFLKGRVIDIAADSTKNEAGQWGYVVRIAPESRYLKVGKDRLPIRPGMTATIDVTTDKRRLITYFFAPIVRTIQDAMGER